MRELWAHVAVRRACRRIVCWVPNAAAPLTFKWDEGQLGACPVCPHRVVVVECRARVCVFVNGRILHQKRRWVACVVRRVVEVVLLRYLKIYSEMKQRLNGVDLFILECLLFSWGHFDKGERCYHARALRTFCGQHRSQHGVRPVRLFIVLEHPSVLGTTFSFGSHGPVTEQFLQCVSARGPINEMGVERIYLLLFYSRRVLHPAPSGHQSHLFGPSGPQKTHLKSRLVAPF